MIAEETKARLMELSLCANASNLLLSDLEHPNRMPFAGVMTYFNVPSDRPVGGAGGKRVLIPAEYGMSGLASLKGMAVNMDGTWLDKHVTGHKIGIIEDVEVSDSMDNGAIPIFVSGYIFAHDFPEEATTIKELQASLGFSYETIDTPVMPGIYEGEEILVVCGDVMFSGAAILLKEKGAYTTTSLVANAEEQEVDQVDINEIIDKVITALTEKYDLTAKAELTEVEEVKPQEQVTEEKPAEEVTETEEVKEEVPAADEKVEEEVPAVEEKELKAEAEVTKEKSEVETVDFKAMAEELQAKYDTLAAELEQTKANLKAEAEAKFVHEHKSVAFPTTLVGKYNFQAGADDYEAQIKAVDARTDLTSDERWALKCELRDQHLKSLKK